MSVLPHFLHPAWLLGVPLLLGLAAWLAHRQAHAWAWAAVVDRELLGHLRLPAADKHASPWPLIALGWALAATALAGPSFGHKQGSAYRVASAWVLLLDLSPSMSVTDLRPDRITRARYAVADLLTAARDVRVALVVFAGEPHTVTPLTTDVGTVRTLLRPLAPRLMPESGDELAPALQEAAQLLRGAHASQGQIIVLSDGFDDVESATLEAQRLHEQGMTVHVVSVGTEAGAPLPDPRGGFQHDERGEIVLARLAPAALEAVATAGGGRLVSLAQLPSLTAALQHLQARTLDGEQPLDARAAAWRNDGVWLLPPLLLLVGLIARRGWL
ncbi:MAG TPA: VWA domain-containing protein [Steroidobacteraceae bacterium]|nr:VWA domain-containing protein [Steroidobacteraceae bacterium]